MIGVQTTHGTQHSMNTLVTIDQLLGTGHAGSTEIRFLRPVRLRL
jgi:hypothetical protein